MTNLPTGATAEQWVEGHYGLPDRLIFAAPRDLGGGISVRVTAVQLGDGTITEPVVGVLGAEDMTAGQARALAAQLVAAADELDAWTAP